MGPSLPSAGNCLLSWTARNLSQNLCSDPSAEPMMCIVFLPEALPHTTTRLHRTALFSQTISQGSWRPGLRPDHMPPSTAQLTTGSEGPSLKTPAPACLCLASSKPGGSLKSLRTLRVLVTPFISLKAGSLTDCSYSCC